MKQLVFVFLFILFYGSVQSQNYDKVDARVSLYPKKYATTDQLARQIQQDFTSDFNRVRAIYTWLATNVSYDLKTLYNGETQINFSYSSQEDLSRKLTAINTHTANQTLLTNKAICEGYAQAFKKVSEQLGIPCMLVGGFSKSDVRDIGSNPSQEDHAWNAVKIQNKWYLVDATWGAGYTNGDTWVQRFDDFFFLTDPNKFAITHYPSEKEWQLIKRTMTKKQFYAAPIYAKSFFKNNLKLISPLQGELFVKSDSDIIIEIGVIPKNTTLYYVFKGDKFSVELAPNCTDEKCTLNIPFVKNRNSELLIFIDKQIALQYKITLQN